MGPPGITNGYGITDALSRKQSVCVIAQEYKHENILISLHPDNRETPPVRVLFLLRQSTLYRMDECNNRVFRNFVLPAVFVY